MTELLSRGTVVGFGRALDAALYDTRLEDEGTSITYFYDADLVIRVIRGFEDCFPVSDRTPKQLLIGSLLSSGYLGKIVLLRPHGLELDTRLRTWAVNHNRVSLQGYQARAERFLDERGVRQELQQLLSVISQHSSQAERAKHFLDALPAVALETFVYLELTSAPWEQRLRRLVYESGGEILSSRLAGESIRELLSAPKLDRYKEILSNSSNKRRYLSDLRDATALVILRSYIKTGRQVRFYTETPTLKRAWAQHADLRESLTTPDKAGSRTSLTARSVWRDELYYLIRASFQELRFPGVDVHQSIEPLVTREELGRISRTLLSLPTDLSPAEMEERIAGMEIGDRSVPQIISDLEDLSFAGRVWATFRPTQAIRAIFQDVDQVWIFARSQPAVQELQTRILDDVRRLKEGLATQVAEIKEWFSRCKTIQRRAEALKPSFSTFATPDPMRDLGLVRWGVEASKEIESSIRAYWNNLFGETERELVETASSLAARAEALASHQDCVVVCSLLWVLGLFDEVEITLRRYRIESSTELPSDLQVLEYAAILRGASRLSSDIRDRALAQVERIVAKKGSSTRRSANLLGSAYILFYCWYLKNRSKLFQHKPHWAEESIPWLETSFSLGEQAIGLAEPSSLQRAFGINHCIYVGSVGGIHADKVAELVPRLMNIQPTQHWNYRFFDTLAYRNYIRAIRTYNSSHGGPSSLTRASLERIAEMLGGAKDGIEKASPAYGDSEIEAHRDQIHDFRMEVQLRLEQLRQ